MACRKQEFYRWCLQDHSKTLRDGIGTNGSAVQQQKYTGAESQLWRIQNIGASHFRITSVASGKVMDISRASRRKGKLLQYDWADAYNQKWHVLDCGGDITA